MVNTTASKFIVQSLVDAGVRHVYGGHGGALVPLVNAIVDHPQAEWVCTRNEASASLAAAASAKLAGIGGLGCCIATSGPGASNLVTGLLDAQLDRVPVIAITGTRPRADAAHSEFQDIDQSRLFAAGGIAFSVTVSDPLQLVSVLRDAVAIALTQRVCVHVAVPVDIQMAELQAPEHLCSAQPMELRRRAASLHGDPYTLEQVAQLLRRERRVVFAVGLEARHAGPEVMQLAEAVGAPVVTRLDAKGAVDESHPLALGVIGVHGKPGLAATAAVIEAATLVVAFGVSELTALLCDSRGRQVRRMVEVAPDALSTNTRFRAEQTLLADPAAACLELYLRLRVPAGTPPPPPPAAAAAAAAAEEAEAAGGSEQQQEALEVWRQIKRGAWSEGVVSTKHGGWFSAAGLPTPSHPGLPTRGFGDGTPSTSSRGGAAAPSPLAAVAWRETSGGGGSSPGGHRRLAADGGGGSSSPATPPPLISHGASRFQLGDQSAASADGYCHPARVLAQLGGALGPADVVCVDTGDVTLWASLCLCLSRRTVTLSSERLGTMGYALCAGIAASLMRGAESRVVVVVGDGGFQMTCNELATAVQHKARLLIVLVDNGLLGRVEFGFKNAKGCAIAGCDWVALARAYGAEGAWVESDDAVEAALDEGLRCEGVFILAVRADPTVKADMTKMHDAVLPKWLSDASGASEKFGGRI